MMIARLYRGPANNKRVSIKDDTAAVNVPLMVRGGSFGVKELVQERYVRTNHTHPDGSVYFEWTKPKGTKIRK